METITTYHHIDNKVMINGHAHVSAPAKVVQCLVLDEFIVLLLDPNELNIGANIYCYNMEGKIEWIIPEPDKLHERNYYTSIYVLKDLNLYAYAINGIETKIDYKTGEILSTELIK